MTKRTDFSKRKWFPKISLKLLINKIRRNGLIFSKKDGSFGYPEKLGDIKCTDSTGKLTNVSVQDLYIPSERLSDFSNEPSNS